MENIEELKKCLEKKYCLEVSEVKLIAEKGKKKVWEVVSPNGKKVLKKIPVSESRANFITAVLKHLDRQGVKVPQVIPTRSGKQYHLSSKGQIYLLMDFVIGTKPDFNNHLEYIVKAMARFHKAMHSFDIKPYVNIPDRRGTWINSYRKRQKKLLEIKLCTLENNEVAQVFLQNISYFLNKAHKAQLLLEQSDYFQWVQKTGKEINVCHLDFIPQNLMLNANNELYVFDMDTLTIDLPALDLRKLFNSVCKRRGKWDAALVDSMVSFYNSVNPLTAPEWKVVFIDLMYPHLFYSLVNSYCCRRVPGCLNSLNIKRLKRVIEFEKSKDEFFVF